MNEPKSVNYELGVVIARVDQYLTERGGYSDMGDVIECFSDGNDLLFGELRAPDVQILLNTVRSLLSSDVSGGEQK